MRYKTLRPLRLCVRINNFRAFRVTNNQPRYIMSKKYKPLESDSPSMASEPTCTYNNQVSRHTPVNKTTAKEQVMSSTVSVDEYFDELISLVHKDYANL